MGENETKENEHTLLIRVLGLREAVALGVGGTIGGGIFVLVGAAAGLAGPGVLVSFILAFCAAAMIALPYAELACRFPKAGGGYAFVQGVLGPIWGFVMGWGYWGAYIFVSGYVTLGFGGYLHTLTGFNKIAGAVALIITISMINLAGVKISGRAQTIIVSLALVSLVVSGLLGLPHFQPGNFTPLMPNGLWGVLQAALLAFLAFGGFDMVAAAGEEIKQPSRNLPLAILLTLAISLGLYLLVTYVAIGVLPWRALGSSPAPLADSTTVFLGPIGSRVISVVALLTTAATANAVLVTTSRISFAMARDSLLPSGLASVHPTTNVPNIAVLVNAGLLIIVTMAGSIEFATKIGGFLYVCQFLLPLVSLGLLRRRPVATLAFEMPLPSIILPLACITCLVLLASSGAIGLLGGVGWLLIGLIVYHRTSLFSLLHYGKSMNQWRIKKSDDD